MTNLVKIHGRKSVFKAVVGCDLFGTPRGRPLRFLIPIKLSRGRFCDTRALRDQVFHELFHGQALDHDGEHHDDVGYGLSRRAGRGFLCWGRRTSNHFELLNRDLIDAVADLPEIVGHLHAEPGLRGGAERLGQPNRHVDGHSGVLIDELGEGLTRDPEPLCRPCYG